MAPVEHPPGDRGEVPVQPSQGREWKEESSHPHAMTLLDLTDWAYFSLDSSGRLVEVSQHLAELLSTSRNALSGVPFTSLCAAPYAAHVKEYLLPGSSPNTRKIRADRLRLFLSLRPPPANQLLVDSAGAQPVDAGIALPIQTGSEQPESSAVPGQKSIPVELVAVFTERAKFSCASEQVAVEGVLRRLPEASQPNRRLGEVNSHPMDHWQNIHRQLHAILQIGQRVATSEDLDTVLNRVVQSLSQDLRYRYADIFLLSEDGKSAVLRASSTVNLGHSSGFAPVMADLRCQLSEQNIVGDVIKRGEAILISDVIHHLDQARLIYRPGAQAILVVPLMISAGAAGVLVAQSDIRSSFTLDDVILLQILADHIAIAIENASLLGERDQHLAELAALSQIGMLLAWPGELMDTLNAIIRQVVALFQVEAASLILVEDGRLYFKVAAGTHIDDIKPYTLEIGQGIAGWAVEHNQTVRVNDVTADSRHYPGIDETINFDTRSLIAVPMRIAKRPVLAPGSLGEERVIGVIEIINRSDGRPFTRNDEILVEFIASSAAVVVENVRLFNELQHRLADVSALLETSRATTTLELQAVLDTTVERVSTALDAEQSIVYLLDAESGRLIPHAANVKLQAEELRQLVVALGQGSVGKIAETRQPLLIDDVQSDSRVLSAAPGSDRVRCSVGVPLTVQNELIGVLEVVNKKNRGHFTFADEALLSAFGGQVALAIHNARLYRETQRRVEDLTALGQASEAINRALSLDEILQAAVQAATALMPSHQGTALLLRKGQTDSLCVAVSESFERDTLDALNCMKIDESDQRGIRLISDALSSHLLHSMSKGPAPLISVPLRGREEVIGLIALGAPFPTYETARLLQTLGDMAAIAIEKASLHEETSRRLAEVSTLYALANQITTVLDLDRILETTVTIIHHALDCHGCCLYFYSPETGDLTLKASSGWGRGKGETAALELISEVSRQVLRERRPMNLTGPELIRTASGSSYSQVPEDSPSSMVETSQIKNGGVIRSLLVVPLVTKNNLIGTLSVNDDSSGAFGLGDRRLLTIAAAQVSVAIENARLLRNLHDRALQLEQALDELRELHRLKTEFLQNVSHELRTPLTFIKSYVQLILEDAMGEINPELRGALTIVDQRTDAVIRLVNDVISLEQMEMGKFEFQPVSLAEVAARSVEGAAMTARKSNINIQLQIIDDLPLLHADPGRLGQVFDNLLGNAIKFSPSGKSITVSVWRDGPFARADVEDHGIGIPADKLDQIFDRFYQVDGSTTRRYGGTGLGLAIVKSIVQSHGGQIIVESEPGIGSTFSFILPFALSRDAKGSTSGSFG